MFLVVGGLVSSVFSGRWVYVVGVVIGESVEVLVVYMCFVVKMRRVGWVVEVGWLIKK